MRMLAKMSWLQLKLFIREPITVLFAVALPLLVLFVMGGVFGNDVDGDFYRGVGAMDYYVPAYIALVTASVGLISLPAHIAGDRERGVLKRYHASSMPAWVIVGSEVIVTFVIAAASSVVLIAVAVPAYDLGGPDSLLVVLGGFALTAFGIRVPWGAPRGGASHSTGCSSAGCDVVVPDADAGWRRPTAGGPLRGDGHGGGSHTAPPRDSCDAGRLAEPGCGPLVVDPGPDLPCIGGTGFALPTVGVREHIQHGHRHVSGIVDPCSQPRSERRYWVP